MNGAQVTAALEGFRPAALTVVVRHVKDSTLGMARWIRRGPDLADENDLDDYMHEVAGRVGWLLTELFALDIPRVARLRERMMALGAEFGLGLQTVNVIRGLHADWRRGWIYVPYSFLESGSDPEQLFRADRNPEREERVLSRLVEKSERHLDAALHYVMLIPRRHHGVRLFCLLPYLFAVRTLALSRDNRTVFRQEAKIGREEVHRIVRTARLMGWSNRWIRWYGGRLSTV